MSGARVKMAHAESADNAELAREVQKTAVPRLRFKGCEGAWEKVTLSELGIFVSGVGFPESEQGGKIGIPFFKVSDMNNVGNESVMHTANNYVTEEQIKRYGWRIVHDVPAIFFAKVGAAVFLNRKRLVKRPFLMDNNTMSYLLSEHWNDEFARSLFEQLDLPSLVQVGALPSLSASIVGALKVHIPNTTDEQRQVGEFAHGFDTLIRSASSRLSSLRQLKRAMLVKMFPRPGQRVPEIRFKRFKGEWEEKRVRDVAERVTRKNVNQESDLPLTISAEHGLIDQREVFNNRIAAKDVSNYYLVMNGEFAYNRSTSDGAPFGAVKRLDRYAKGVLSTLYMVFALKDESIDSDYLVQYYVTSLWHRDIALRAAEGARNHGLLNISVEDFFDTRIVLPSSLPEQRKIAAFFRNLDRLIGAAEKKVAKLRQVKASLLERMFV